MGKGPTRRQGIGKKESQESLRGKRDSRVLHKDVNQNSAGPHSSPKGAKGYDRKQKHKNKDDETISEELTPVDETFRGYKFPMARSLHWDEDATSDDNEHVSNDNLINKIDSPSEYSPPAEKFGGDGGGGGDSMDFHPRTTLGDSAAEDDDETPVIDTPGFPPTKEGGGNVPDEGAAWGFSIAAALNWSTHTPETFDDTGEKGEHPAWGLKSIIDRGVKPHEKPDGAKRIEDAENSTQKRSVPNKSFKSYSMLGAFNW
jgi:hypothetical protein